MSNLPKGITPLPCKQTDKIDVHTLSKEELERLLSLGEPVFEQTACKLISDATDEDLEGFCFCTDEPCDARPCASYPTDRPTALQGIRYYGIIRWIKVQYRMWQFWRIWFKS